MIAGLVNDTYEDFQKEFIPHVIKETSTISISGKRLIAFELVLKDFQSKGGTKATHKTEAN